MGETPVTPGAPVTPGTPVTPDPNRSAAQPPQQPPPPSTGSGSANSVTPPAAPASPPAEEQERTLWEGGPSQLIGIWWYLLCALGVLAGIALTVVNFRMGFWPLLISLLALIVAAFKWLAIGSRHYKLTTERLITTSGMGTRRTNELELYRVKDYTLVEPFWYRLAGLGNVVLATSDKTNPNLTIPAIKGAGQVREMIRKHVELIRTRKGVHELDVEPLP